MGNIYTHIINKLKTNRFELILHTSMDRMDGLIKDILRPVCIPAFVYDENTSQILKCPIRTLKNTA